MIESAGTLRADTALRHARIIADSRCVRLDSTTGRGHRMRLDGHLSFGHRAELSDRWDLDTQPVNLRAVRAERRVEKDPMLLDGQARPTDKLIDRSPELRVPS